MDVRQEGKESMRQRNTDVDTWLCRRKRQQRNCYQCLYI
jgi:hypothetical protein